MTTQTSTWETITPAIATKYLETMDGNRSVRQTRVDFYAAQMRAGLWRKVPQGIIFDSAGRLVDGQHRMWAIVESGCAVVMYVHRGMSPEDVAALDTGLIRGFADVAHYAGWEKTDPSAAGIAKILVMGVGNCNRMVPAEVMNGWREHYDEGIEFACKIRLGTRGVGSKVIPLSVAAPFARAYYTEDRAALERMGQIIKTGVIEHTADRAAIALRDAWLTRRLGTSDTERYQKAEAAIRAFLERRPIKNLQRAESELFAIPKLPGNLKYETQKTRGAARTATLQAAA